MKKIDQKKTLRKILFGGLFLSLAIIIVGLILFASNPQGDDTVLPLYELPKKLTVLDPNAVLDLGILFLIATPAVGVLSISVTSMLNREPRFVIISVIVLFLLIASFALSFFR